MAINSGLPSADRASNNSAQACVSQKTRKLLGPENGPVKPPKKLSGVSGPRKYVIFSSKLYGYSLAPEKRFRDPSLQCPQEHFLVQNKRQGLT